MGFMVYKEIGGNRKRVNRISFYLTDEELELFENKFKKTIFTSKSEYIREAVLNGIIVIKDYTHYKELINEINKIGVNINQIAKIANASGELYQGQMAKLLLEMDKIWDKLSEEL